MPKEVEDFINQILTKVTLEDIPLLSEYLKKANYNLSNYNVVNILMWSDAFKMYKYHGKNWLIIISVYRNKLFVSMPLCEKIYFYDALKEIKTRLHENKIHYKLVNFTQERADEIVQRTTRCFSKEVSNLSDYVYLTHNLRTFEGHGLKKRRGCLNNFYKNIGDRYTYEALNETNAKECLEFLDEWKKGQDNFFINAEKEGVKKILENWSKFDAKGGIIRVDKKVSAFIIGSCLCDDTCQINIEKGDITYRGIYQVVLKEFLEREFLDKKYLNREDDMGDENMKSAKLAYDPEVLIKKLSLVCSDAVES